MTRAGMKIRRALRLVGWNVLFLVAGLALIGVIGEMYFRLVRRHAKLTPMRHEN